MQSDEIYLIDLWRVVRRRWLWMAGVALATCTATFAWLHVARHQWEALATVQVGQVGTAPSGMDPKVEPFARVLQRLQSVGFQAEVLRRMGVAKDSDAGRLYIASLALEPDPYANLIRLRVRAYSPAEARRAATATVDRLVAIHAALSQAQLAVTRARSADIDQTLASAQGDRDRIARDLQGASHADAMVANVALADTDAGIRTLKQIRGDFDARMTPSYTFPTSMPWPVTVSDHAVAPAQKPLMIIGVLVGLVLGVVAATAADARARSTKRAPAGTYATQARHGG
ncbi:Wzz/FepE/Etk N-terminal domain-containing protein [Luteibacter sp. PPL552]